MSEAVLTAIYRAVRQASHGAAGTLDQMLAQEGWAVARAGCTTPRLASEDLARTREVIAAHRPATGRATQTACLFGDACARALGHRPLGLSERTGLALALHDAGPGR